MNNNLLKENAIMIWYITNFIEQLEEDIEKLEKVETFNTNSDIKLYISIKKYFEKCLEEVYGKRQ